MAKDKTVKTTLKLNKECGKVARFDFPDQQNFEVVKNAYITNEAYATLGKPKEIDVVITPHG